MLSTTTNQMKTSVTFMRPNNDSGNVIPRAVIRDVLTESQRNDLMQQSAVLRKLVSGTLPSLRTCRQRQLRSSSKRLKSAATVLAHPQQPSTGLPAAVVVEDIASSPRALPVTRPLFRDACDDMQTRREGIVVDPNIHIDAAAPTDLSVDLQEEKTQPCSFLAESFVTEDERGDEEMFCRNSMRRSLVALHDDGDDCGHQGGVLADAEDDMDVTPYRHPRRFDNDDSVSGVIDRALSARRSTSRYSGSCKRSKGAGEADCAPSPSSEVRRDATPGALMSLTRSLSRSARRLQDHDETSRGASASGEVHATRGVATEAAWSLLLQQCSAQKESITLSGIQVSELGEERVSASAMIYLSSSSASPMLSSPESSQSQHPHPTSTVSSWPQESRPPSSLTRPLHSMWDDEVLLQCAVDSLLRT